MALVAFAGLTGTVDLSSAGWVHGLKIAAVAVVALAVWSMARTLTPDWPRRTIGLVATAIALAWISPMSQVAIMAGGALAGSMLLQPAPEHAGRAEPSPISSRVGIVALCAFLVLLVGLPVAAAALGSHALTLFEAFYRSGSLVFGGGHVVLPLLHGAVVDSGWVDGTGFSPDTQWPRGRAPLHVRRVPRGG